MKKQINPTIKAHLTRGAFYLLVLLAVCAIPFALAQRAGTKQRIAKQSMIKPAVAKRTAANKAQFSVTANGADPQPAGHAAGRVPVDVRGAAVPATTQRGGHTRLVTGFPVDARNFSAQPGSKVFTTQPGGTSSILWYNGDFNGVNGLANEENTSIGSGEFASVYDDFNVPSGPGWTVTSVFSDNLSSTNITGATWEIRQGISEGNGGTLIASGTTVTPVVTPTFYGIHGRGYRAER